MKRSHRGRCSNESEEVELERGEIGRACWSERRLGRTFPVGPRTSFKLKCLVMPLLPNLRKQIFTSYYIAYLHITLKEFNIRVDAMATRTPRLRFFARAKPSQSIPGCVPARRQFATSATRSTDGVFRALTENRVRTPWIEALTKKQQEGKDPSRASGIPETPSDRDLSPRSMSDSYHSVVCSRCQAFFEVGQLTCHTRFYRLLKIHGCLTHISTRLDTSALAHC